MLFMLFQAGWIGIGRPHKQNMDQKFSHFNINQTVHNTLEQFGAKTIIFQTIPIINNIHYMVEFANINKRIWSYRQLEEDSLSNVKFLVMDIGAFSNSLFVHNAQNLGTISNKAAAELLEFETSGKFSFANQEFGDATAKLLEEPFNLNRVWTGRHAKSLTHTCGKLDSDNATDCKVKNMFSMDGQHWCMNIVGQRINAALACLLKCSTDYEKGGELLDCEGRCNSKYMNLSPVSVPERAV